MNRLFTLATTGLLALFALSAPAHAIDRVVKVQLVLEATPTVSASAIYASGDSVGGEITLSNALREKFAVNDLRNGTATIRSVVITDLGKQSANLDVIFFDTVPANGFGDNVPITVTDVDLVNVIGVAQITTWVAFNDSSVGIAHDLYIPFALGTGTKLYAAIVSRGTPTYASTSDLTLRLGLTLD